MRIMLVLADGTHGTPAGWDSGCPRARRLTDDSARGRTAPENCCTPNNLTARSNIRPPNSASSSLGAVDPSDMRPGDAGVIVHRRLPPSQRSARGPGGNPFRIIGAHRRRDGPWNLLSKSPDRSLPGYACHPGFGHPRRNGAVFATPHLAFPTRCIMSIEVAPIRIFSPPFAATSQSANDVRAHWLMSRSSGSLPASGSLPDGQIQSPRDGM